MAVVHVVLCSLVGSVWSMPKKRCECEMFLFCVLFCSFQHFSFIGKERDMRKRRVELFFPLAFFCREKERVGEGKEGMHVCTSRVEYSMVWYGIYRHYRQYEYYITSHHITTLLHLIAYLSFEPLRCEVSELKSICMN